MSELQNILQTSNGAFKSELMNVFMSQHKSDHVKSGAAPASNLNQNIKLGASIFANTTSTSGLTPDNANILQTQNLADNKTAGLTGASITATATDNSKDLLIMGRANANEGPDSLNMNVNVNMNRNVVNAAKATSTPSQSEAVPDPNANVSDAVAILEEARSALSENRQLLVHQITDAVVDAHLATCINTHKAVSEAAERIMAMKESGGLPDLSKLSLSASSMWQQFMAQMMPELSNAIKFCKMLPGFSELPLDDQMKLIKQGSFEVMMTRFCMLIDHQKETMMDPSHKMCCPRQVIREMPMGQFLDGFFSVAHNFNPIGLTDGEIGLFTAVLIVCPTRHGLTEVKSISSLQSLYQQSLFHLMKKNHSDPQEKFVQLMSQIPMFREINEEHSKALGAMKMNSPEGFDMSFPPLHKEMDYAAHA